MFFSKRRKQYADKINNYFCNAVTVYVLASEEDARLAALAAAKTVDSRLRATMVAYLSGMASSCLRALIFLQSDKPDKVLGADAAKALLELKRDIEAKEWGIKDARNEKRKLNELNPEYHQALEKPDPDIFIRKYPNLFSIG